MEFDFKNHADGSYIEGFEFLYGLHNTGAVDDFLSNDKYVCANLVVLSPLTASPFFINYLHVLSKHFLEFSLCCEMKSFE